MLKHFFMAGIVAMSAARVAFAAETEIAELTKRAETQCEEQPENERADCVKQRLSKWQSPEHIAMMKDANRIADQIFRACRNDDLDRFSACAADRVAKAPEAARPMTENLLYFKNLDRSIELRKQRQARTLADCHRLGITKQTARIGMTSQMVLDCGWGEPDNVNRTRTAGRVHEQWVYSDGTYLYFDNGKLTAIQD